MSLAINFAIQQLLYRELSSNRQGGEGTCKKRRLQEESLQGSSCQISQNISMKQSLCYSSARTLHSTPLGILSSQFSPPTPLNALSDLHQLLRALDSLKALHLTTPLSHFQSTLWSLRNPFSAGGSSCNCRVSSGRRLRQKAVNCHPLDNKGHLWLSQVRETQRHDRS